jgi:predicted Zn-dependent protease
MKTKNETDSWSDENIVARAKALANDESTLGHVMGVTDEELYATASIALLMAAHGKFKDASIIMDGLLALSPHDGFLHTLYCDVLFMAGDENGTIKVIEESISMKNIGNLERIRRAEMALKAGFYSLSRDELLIIKDEKLHGDLEKRKEAMLEVLSKIE